MTHRWIPALLLLAACGGGGAPSNASPNESAATPDAAVRLFMQAVADSNIARMARFWGSGKGPASVTRTPADFQQRMSVTQTYLRNSPYRVVGIDPIDKKRTMVTTEFDRTARDGSRCIKRLPIEVLDAGQHGWIVTAMDLNLVGSPNRPCSST